MSLGSFDFRTMPKTEKTGMPDSQTLLNLVLTTLYNHQSSPIGGGAILAKAVADQINHAPQDLLTQRYTDDDGHSGAQVFKTVCGGAISKLRVAGYTQKGKLGWQLTPAGKQLWEEHNGQVPATAINHSPAYIKYRAQQAAKRASKRSEQQMAALRAQKAEPGNDVTDPESSRQTIVEAFTSQWRDDLLSSLKHMNAYAFERFCQELITQMGVEFEPSDADKKARDGGIDGLGYIRTEDFRTQKVVIQAKRWQGSVPGPEISNFRGVISDKGADYGIFITTSSFTSDAKKRAHGTAGRPITLIDGEGIADLVAKYELHVQPVTTYVLSDYYEQE